MREIKYGVLDDTIFDLEWARESRTRGSMQICGEAE